MLSKPVFTRWRLGKLVKCCSILCKKWFSSTTWARITEISSLAIITSIFWRRYRQGMVWNGMEDDFSIFHTGHFLTFRFHSIPKIFHSIFHSLLKFSSAFHSILQFSSIFHSILPYQRNFRLEVIQRIFCCFAPLQCGKQPLVEVRQQY